MTLDNDFSGIWLSKHRKTSGARSSLVTKFFVTISRINDELIVKSIPNTDGSYMNATFTLEQNVATGSYQSYNAPNTAAKGSVYYGVAQLVLNAGGKSLKGKGVGFSKSGKVESTIWELTYHKANLGASEARASAGAGD